MASLLIAKHTAKGTRVRFSALYLNSARVKQRERQGTIVGYGKDGVSLVVHWDGTQTITRQSYHESFLERVEAA